MEACSKGFCKIAKWLIHSKANVLQTDDDGWTAVDYLQEHINFKEISLSDAELNNLRSLLGFLQQKQRNGNFRLL